MTAGCSTGERAAAAIVALALALGLALVMPGCSGGGNGRMARDPQQRAQELIESGNSAYRAGSYRLAARRYAAAAVVKKDDPAAYYGMGMALSKLGRDEEARRAYARARELVQAQARPPQAEHR